jgi:hypothetical protein
MSTRHDGNDGLAALRLYPDDATEDERRAALVVRAARRDVSFRDFLTFALVRSWTAVLAIGAVLFALFGARQKVAR